MPDDLKQRQLQAVLSERDSLRAEMLQKFQHHLQLYSLLAPVLAGGAGVAIGKHYYVGLVFVPLVSTTFACRFLWEEHVINSLGEYLLDTECCKLRPLLVEKVDEVPTRTGHPAFSELWVGWEHYFLRYSTAESYRPYKVGAWLAFIALPFVPAILYSLLVVIQYFFEKPAGLIAGLPVWAHAVALVVNSALLLWLSRRLRKSLGPTTLQGLHDARS